MDNKNTSVDFYDILEDDNEEVINDSTKIDLGPIGTETVGWIKSTILDLRKDLENARAEIQTLKEEIEILKETPPVAPINNENPTVVSQAELVIVKALRAIRAWLKSFLS